MLSRLAAEEAPSTDILDVVTGPATESSAKTAADGTTAATPSTESTPAGIEDPMSSAQAPTPDAPPLRLVPSGTSWSNVWIAGNKVWAYRAKQPHYDVDLPPGTYSIEVRDFTDKEVWLKGTLVLVADRPAELHFGPNTPTQALGGSWTAE
jgi:hypothetical protein